MNNMLKKKPSCFPQAWIGLYFDVISWAWSLSDEDFYHNNANYTNWVPGQPDSVWYTEQCAHMYVNGQWYDCSCQALYKPICSNVSGKWYFIVILT